MEVIFDNEERKFLFNDEEICAYRRLHELAGALKCGHLSREDVKTVDKLRFMLVREKPYSQNNRKIITELWEKYFFQESNIEA